MFVSARVKPHFCGACSAISCRCLGLCLLSSCFLGAGQARVCLCGFRSCILSHGIPDGSPYIHTFCLFFFLPPLFFPCFFFFLLGGQHTTKSAAATNGLSNLSVCLTALGASCLKCTYRSGCVLIIHVDWQEHMKIHYFTVCKLPIATQSL